MSVKFPRDGIGVYIKCTPGYIHTFTPKASSCLVCLKQFKHLAYLPYILHNTIVFIPIATPWKWATKKRICIEPKQQRASSCPSPAKPLKNSTSVPKTLECPETFAGNWAIPLPSPCLVSWSPRLRMLVSWWDGGVLVGRELPLCKNYPSSFLYVWPKWDQQLISTCSPVFIFFGGMVQIFGGVGEWIIGNTFSCALFFTYGMFKWLWGSHLKDTDLNLWWYRHILHSPRRNLHALLRHGNPFFIHRWLLRRRTKSHVQCKSR